MGDKDEKKPPQCTTCRGQGGWWEHGNGKPGTKPKRWIKCQMCQGKGTK